MKNSPITGKPMSLVQEERILQFRKEDFPILYHYYLCEDSGETFETEDLLHLNLEQVYNQYRERHRLPFPDEIAQIRERYGVSAAKMSEILGFGANGYRNYEAGEVPSISNGRLIQLSADPGEFRRLTELSDCLKDRERKNIQDRIKALENGELEPLPPLLERYLYEELRPGLDTGYRRPNMQKFCAMTAYLAQHLEPFKVKMCKLLFYADFSHFKQHGQSISGTRYIAIAMGPVPDNFDGLFNEARKRGAIHIAYQENSNWEKLGERFQAGEKADFSSLSKGETKTLDHVVKRFERATTAEIIQLSHREKGWLDCREQKGVISYKYGFWLLDD
ncbi:MAG: DUF4065 domain-containing protein [Saprospirales bacterium]|nr:DUF4065 domain-containing protein [Saprospirales bacterium]